MSGKRAALSLGRRRCVWEAGERGTRAHPNRPGGRPVLDTQGHVPDPQGELVMEALLIIGLLLALAILAARFGHDSREHIASQEELLAQRGLTWAGSSRRSS